MAVTKGARMVLKITAGIVSLAAVVGLGTLSMEAYAQDAPTASDSSQSVQNSSGDMAARVKQALHAQPALNDKHIDVSMKDGKVVMAGFVNSQGDLVKAIRTAGKTAGSKNVINELKIKRDDDLNPTGSSR
jgi:osmotically-inducible protein OsmY